MDWLAQKQALKPSSTRSLEASWRIHVKPRWEKEPVGKVTHARVQAWINSDFKGKSPTVVIRAYGVLAGIFDVAVRERLVNANLARGVVVPRRVKGMHDYLTKEQLRAVVDECGPHGSFVLFLATTGLRRGEAVGLLGKHVDRKRNRVTVERAYAQLGSRYELGSPKSHEMRSVPVPALVLERMSLVVPGAHVWALKGKDAPIPRPSPESGWFDQAVARCMKADKHFPRISPHDLRHTAVSLAISEGANVKAIQRTVGHASAAMTLDDDADLFDEDLDAVGVAMNAVVGKMWADAVS